jgi:hypothetical protein
MGFGPVSLGGEEDFIILSEVVKFLAPRREHSGSLGCRVMIQEKDAQRRVVDLFALRQLGHQASSVTVSRF